MKTFLLVSFFVAVAQCTEISFGKCPDLSTVENFQAADYLGTWYEYSKYSQVFESGSCATATYSLNDDGTVKVVNSQKQQSGEIYKLEGVAKFTEGTTVAKLSVKFPVQPVPAPYWVLGTDYKKYAVVWTCVELASLLNGQSVWILTRERIPSQAIVDEANSVLKANNLSLNALIPTVQTNCDALTL